MRTKDNISIRCMVMVLCITICFIMMGTEVFASSNVEEELLDDTTICDEGQVLRDQNTIDVDPEIIFETRAASKTTWNSIRNQTDKGNILITKDDNTPVIDHGHCALVYSAGTQTAEIFGKG